MAMQLLDAIALVDRGFTATAEDKKIIDKLASKLERANPNKNSLAADEINGKWKLLYTTSQSILGQKRPFFLRPLGPIYQFIGALTRTCRLWRRPVPAMAAVLTTLTGDTSGLASIIACLAALLSRRIRCCMPSAAAAQ
jgi:PAP_fibrillin